MMQYFTLKKTYHGFSRLPSRGGSGQESIVVLNSNIFQKLRLGKTWIS